MVGISLRNGLPPVWYKAIFNSISDLLPFELLFINHSAKGVL